MSMLGPDPNKSDPFNIRKIRNESVVTSIAVVLCGSYAFMGLTIRRNPGAGRGTTSSAARPANVITACRAACSLAAGRAEKSGSRSASDDTPQHRTRDSPALLEPVTSNGLSTNEPFARLVEVTVDGPD